MEDTFDFSEDDIQEILISNKELKEIAKKIASQIHADFGKEAITLVPVLKGSDAFAQMVSQELPLLGNYGAIFDYVMTRSYHGTAAGELTDILTLQKKNITGKNVILFEDIYDKGNTLAHWVKIINSYGPKKFEVCSLLDKKVEKDQEVDITYIGREIEDKFAVGFGLDYKQHLRNLPYIGVLSDRGIKKIDEFVSRHATK